MANIVDLAFFLSTIWQLWLHSRLSFITTISRTWRASFICIVVDVALFEHVAVVVATYIALFN